MTSRLRYRAVRRSGYAPLAGCCGSSLASHMVRWPALLSLLPRRITARVSVYGMESHSATAPLVAESRGRWRTPRRAPGERRGSDARIAAGRSHGAGPRWEEEQPARLPWRDSSRRGWPGPGPACRRRAGRRLPRCHGALGTGIACSCPRSSRWPRLARSHMTFPKEGRKASCVGEGLVRRRDRGRAAGLNRQRSCRVAGM
jgi:hypothetical protein